MNLRLRLVLLVGAVLVASLAAVFFGSSRLVRVEIQKLEDAHKATGAAERAARHAIRAAIEAHYVARGWSDADALLQRLRSEHSPGRELLVVAGRSHLIAASSVPPGGVRLTPRGADALVVEYTVRNTPVRVMVFPDGDVTTAASLYVIPEWRRQPIVVGRSINRRLLWMIAGVGLLALLATALIARAIVLPVERLQAAVQKVAGGELGEQVQVPASGEIGALASAFNSMSVQLARDAAMRRNMVNDVAHELRTPLTRMLCAVEAVQDGLRSPDAGAMSALHDDLTLLQRLVEDLETLALAESGKLPLHPERVDVAGDIARWARAQPEAQHKRIDLAAAPEVFARVDRVRFQQIIANLVRNALLHGGPAARVRIAAEQTHHAVRVSVSDDGVGIDPVHLPHVFDRFYRADGARSRGTGGSGLGLAIAKQLVELHRGRIAVESEPQRGTTFVIELPAE